MDPTTRKQILAEQIDQISGLKGLEASAPQFQKWKRDTEVAIEKAFGKSGRHLSDFDGIWFSPGAYYQGMPDDAGVRSCQRGLAQASQILQSMIDEISKFDSVASPAKSADGFSMIERVCERFHLVARQLRSRHAGRATLEVEDEYDAQDLIHSLLHLYFDDIRPEEWTPSHAGASSRMDFLLKREKIVVEIKKTRKGLGAKEIGEQLIVDIEKYQGHPDCKSLICFVYDPDGRVANPRGLESDLKQDLEGMKVRVIIAPKGM